MGGTSPPRFGARAKSPLLPRSCISIALAALFLVLASVLVSVVQYHKEVARIADARQLRVNAVAANLRASIQAQLDDVVAEATMLGRLHDSLCVVPATWANPQVLSNQFTAFSNASVENNHNLDALIYAPLVRNNEQRVYVELASAQTRQLPLSPAFTAAAPFYQPVPLPYDNATHAIAALVSPPHAQASAANLLVFSSDAAIRASMLKGALSGQPVLTRLLKDCDMLMLPLLACGKTLAEVAADPSPALSTKLYGWGAVAFSAEKLLAAELSNFARLQPNYRVSVTDLANGKLLFEDVSQHSPEYVSNCHLTIGDATWSLAVSEVICKCDESEERSLLLVVSLPLLLGVVSIFTLILTSMLLQHRATASARRQLQQAMDIHQYVVAYVCHEMRNPLHACQAYLDLGLENLVTESPEQARDLKSAKAAADQMAQVLDDVMDIRKLNEGDLSVAPARMDNVSDVLRDLVNQYKYLLDPAVRLELEAEVVPGVIDKSRLRQVMGNGLHNASKSTSAGFVALVNTSFTLPAGSCLCHNAECQGANSYMSATRSMFDVVVHHGASTPQSTGGGGAVKHREAGQGQGQEQQGSVPWMLCQVISTPSSSLPEEVVQWNQDLMASTSPPEALLRHVAEVYIAPAGTFPEPAPGRGAGSPLSHDSGGTASQARSAWVGGAAPAAGPGNAAATSAAAPTGAQATAKVAPTRKNKAMAKHLRKKAGTGLGLALCARVVKAMDGYMGIHADEQGNIRFWVAVPLQPHECEEADTLQGAVSLVPPSATTPVNIPGALYPAVGLGQAALQPVETPMSPALPLQDLDSVMDTTVEHKPEVMRSASGHSTGSRGVRRGASAHSLKTGRSAGSRSPGGLVVAVVDDEPLVRKTGARFLKKLGHKAVTFDDGLQLLEALLTDGNAEGIQVVLLDITMRHSDGADVCKQLRHAGVAMPIIAMTGLTDEASMQQFSTAGFTRVMPKPFNKAKLAEALRDDIAF